MSYTIKQTKGNSIYVYEVESYWDTDIKQPRQRRVYIGKQDSPDGPLIPKRVPSVPIPKASRDYGHVHLLTEIANRLGLVDILQKVFSKDAELMLLLAFYEVIEERPLYLFPEWVEDVFHKLKSIPGSPKLSELLQGLGHNDRLREDFTEKWIKKHHNSEAVIYDITSVSSHSNFIDLCEWGYNRDGESLPQINIGLVCTLPGQVPLAYRVYPGSLSDVSTLPNTVKYLDSLGISSPMYVLDRGFWSLKNVKMLLDSNFRFLLPIPFTSSHATDLLVATRTVLQTPANVISVQKDILYHMQMPIKINQASINAHVYFNKIKQGEEEKHFYQRIIDIEETVKEFNTTSITRVQKFLNNSAPDIRNCFDIVNENGYIRLQRKNKSMTRRLDSMGYLLLATTETTEKSEASILLYRQRDLIEKVFDSMKHEMDGKRLRVHSREAMEGRLFIMFIAMILRCSVEQACRDAQLFKTYSVAEIFALLKKVKRIELTNGEIMMTELTKKQRTLYEKLNIPIPKGT
jgi:transposase